MQRSDLSPPTYPLPSTTCFFFYQQRVEIHKLRQGENLILGFSIGGGIDQDPSQNPFSEDKTDKVRDKGLRSLRWQIFLPGPVWKEQTVFS